jgi:RimJ/RimL family protein N-acetyltransferase
VGQHAQDDAEIERRMPKPQDTDLEREGFEIRPMSRADLDLAVEWAAAEGWNPGLADAGCFHATDPEGFLMAFGAGEPVASISVVRYAGGFAFLGFYIVRPEFRGRGYGLRLWRAGMARLDGSTVGLDGVVGQQANYARSGFTLAHRNIRYGGVARLDAPSDRRLTNIGADLVPAVAAYDRRFFPAPRGSFLQCWLRPEQRIGVALTETGAIQGYGVVRKCRSGHKIGPLFAETEDHADLLFRALASTATDGPIFLDVPEPNRAGAKLAARHGLSPVFETARMYRGIAPALPLDDIYGITTFELG